MTREFLLKNWDLINAYKNGADIEHKSMTGDWKPTNTPMWLSHVEYRVKPEPKVIPFDFSDAEILIGKAVKSIGKEWVGLITVVYNDGLFNDGWYSFEYLLENFTFLDGSPCGKIVENGAV